MKTQKFDADNTISLLPETRLACGRQICRMKNSTLRPGCVSAGLEGLEQTLQSYSFRGDKRRPRFHLSLS